jgi:hypothetical protein
MTKGIIAISEQEQTIQIRVSAIKKLLAVEKQTNKDLGRELFELQKITPKGRFKKELFKLGITASKMRNCIACFRFQQDTDLPSDPEHDDSKDPMFSSDSVEWYTPQHIVEHTINTLGEIDLDPCSNEDKNIPATHHYTKDDDGLSKIWNGRIYMNPPYGDTIGQWTEKLLSEFNKGNVKEAIALLPARVDTAWFRPFTHAIFVSGRLKFSGVDNSAPFPSVLIYLGNNWEKFKTEFKGIGEPWRKDIK